MVNLNAELCDSVLVDGRQLIDELNKIVESDLVRTYAATFLLTNIVYEPWPRGQPPHHVRHQLLTTPLLLLLLTSRNPVNYLL